MESWSCFGGDERVNCKETKTLETSCLNPSTGNLGIQEIVGFNANGAVCSNSVSWVQKDPSALILDATNGKNSSWIDLKLGRASDDQKETISSSSSVSGPDGSYKVAKRHRAGNWNSQIPVCQVDGCREGLRSCKEYHRRHRVCEVHSKSVVAIVDGIEQRFCQQCSRFHELAEFDYGKRSCRKRLADHNERRRKPRIGITNFNREEKFQDYNATVFQDNGSSPAAVCEDRRVSKFLQHRQNNDADSWNRTPNRERANTFTYFHTPFNLTQPFQNSSTFMDSALELRGDGPALSLLSPLSRDSSAPSARLHAATISDPDATYDEIAKVGTWPAISHSPWIDSEEDCLEVFCRLNA